MSFTVDPVGLTGLPAQLDRLKHHALLGESYLNEHTKLTYRGLLDLIAGNHEHLVQRVRDHLDTLARRTAGNASEAVRIAIGYYQQTDARAAGALDATYPTVAYELPYSADGDRPSPASSGGLFRDVAEPSDRYVAPPDYSAKYQDEPDSLTIVSQAAFGRQVIITATEIGEKLGICHRWDPYEAILKPVTGDWSGLAACKDVFDNLADALGHMGSNLVSAADSVPWVWNGNAASGMSAYLRTVAGELAGLSGPLQDIGKAYETAAEGAFDSFRVLGHLLNDVIDSAIALVGAMAVGAATAETGVGAALGAAVAGYEAYEMYEAIKQALEVWHLCEAAVHTLNAALANGGLVDDSVTLPTIDEAHLQLPGPQALVGRPTISSAHN